MRVTPLGANQTTQNVQTHKIAFEQLNVKYEEVDVVKDLVSKAVCKATKYRPRGQQYSRIETVANSYGRDVNISRPNRDELFLSVNNKEQNYTIMTPRFNTKGYKTVSDLQVAIEDEIEKLAGVLKR